MQEHKTIARPYAVALRRHAVRRGEESEWADTLDFMAAVTRDKTFAAVIADPRVAADTSAEMMLAICHEWMDKRQPTKARLKKGGAGALTSLTRLLAQNGKLKLLPEMAEIYRELQAEAGGAITAAVAVARPLSAKFEQAIAAALKKLFRRDVALATDIDSELLGGAVIRVGDQVIDASVRGRLQGLAATLRT